VVNKDPSPSGPNQGREPMTTRRNHRRSVTQVPVPTEPSGDIFVKTKMCRFHLLGICSKGASCPFAHESTEMNPLPDLSKTKLCKTLINTGVCEDVDCTYAHNREELRVAELPGRGGKTRRQAGRQSACRPLRRAFSGGKGERSTSGMVFARTSDQDPGGPWPLTLTPSSMPEMNAVHGGCVVVHDSGSSSSHGPSSSSYCSQGWQGNLNMPTVSQVTPLDHAEADLVVIQTQCQNGPFSTNSGDEVAAGICADAGLKELFNSGAVAVKNTFLDFEPRPRLRTVQTASGRLDSLAE